MHTLFALANLVIEDPLTVVTETRYPQEVCAEQMFPITDICIDEDTQPRVQLDEEAVDAHAEEMNHRGIGMFPPVNVFLDEENIHWLGDGFHCVTAAQCNGLAEMKTKVRHGGRANALIYNVRANHRDGVMRTNTDKRYSVMLLPVEPDYYVKSDRSTAGLC